MGALIALQNNMHRAYIFADDRGFLADFQPKRGKTLFIYSTEKERDLAVRKWLKQGEYRNPRRALSEYFGVSFKRSYDSKRGIAVHHSLFHIPYYGYGSWVVFYNQRPTVEVIIELNYGPWTFCMLKN